MITIHSLCFNEEIILGFMIDHYRQRFPDAMIVIHDNESTDSSREIALDRGCAVATFTTDGKMHDGIQRELKNTCWKDDPTDRVLVCDADELLDIDKAALRQEDAAGVTLIKSQGFNMVNLKDDRDLAAITHGIESESYSKDYLFNRTEILEINYDTGAHKTAPVGRVTPSRTRYPAYHYRHIHPELSFKKWLRLSARMSDANRLNCWASQYSDETSLESIRQEYETERAAARRVRCPA